MNLSGLPQISLQPGAKGNDVIKLQKWLIANGYDIPSGTTGNYGPETKAAVSALQDKLGVQAGINKGYFGPLTIGAVTKASVQPDLNIPSPFTPTKTTTPSTTVPPVTDKTTPQGKFPGEAPISSSYNAPGAGIVPSAKTDIGTQGIATGDTTTPTTPTQNIPPEMMDALKFMFDDQTIASLPQKDLLNWGLMAEYLKKQNDMGNVAQEINAKTLNVAYTAAVNDPMLQAKYGDALKTAQADMQQFQSQLQTQIGITQTQEQMQFEAERKALAEAHAAAGTAYSGFRGKAQETLGKTEQGIVTSSRAAIQKQLTDATRNFEARYGTAATKPASAEYADPMATSKVSLSGQDIIPIDGVPPTLTGEAVGGITGTEKYAKEADISSRQQQIYGEMSYPTSKQKPITF